MSKSDVTDTETGNDYFNIFRSREVWKVDKKSDSNFITKIII